GPGWVRAQGNGKGGGGGARPVGHFSSVQRRIVPRMRRAVTLVFMACLLETLRCRRKRTGAHPLFGDLFRRSWPAGRRSAIKTSVRGVRRGSRGRLSSRAGAAGKSGGSLLGLRPFRYCV